jgi:rare lipoprotein A
MIKHPVSLGDVYYLYATYYGGDFNGKKAADGSIFNENEMTCAARGFPFGTYLLVQSVDTGKSVVVKVTDRPGKNVVDLSAKSFSMIDDQSRGKIRVKVKVVNNSESKIKSESVAVEKSVFYAIELGSFDNLEKAKEFQKTLKVESYIFALNDSVFKVRFGRFADKNEAEMSMKTNLKGIKAEIVEVNE